MAQNSRNLKSHIQKKEGLLFPPPTHSSLTCWKLLQLWLFVGFQGKVCRYMHHCTPTFLLYTKDTHTILYLKFSLSNMSCGSCWGMSYHFFFWTTDNSLNKEDFEPQRGNPKVQGWLEIICEASVCLGVQCLDMSQREWGWGTGPLKQVIPMPEVELCSLSRVPPERGSAACTSGL